MKRNAPANSAPSVGAVERRIVRAELGDGLYRDCVRRGGETGTVRWPAIARRCAETGLMRYVNEKGIVGVAQLLRELLLNVSVCAINVRRTRRERRTRKQGVGVHCKDSRERLW